MKVKVLICGVILCCITHAVYADSVCISDFGAVADGKTINTGFIQQAIDKCSNSGGGDVRIPCGVYLTGTIILKDNVRLYLEQGAILKGSSSVDDYLPINLVRAENVSNVGIAGPGTINGNGLSFWERRPGFMNPKYSWYPAKQYVRKYKAPNVASRRPREMIKFVDCKNINIESTTFTDAPYWTFHILGCDGVIIRGIKILNYMLGPNTDGIDMEATQNVIISDCYIYTGDDAITMKNQIVGYSHRPIRNIAVTNCVIKTTCNGFKIGSGSNGDFENISFSNSVISAGVPGDQWTRDCETTYGPDHYGNPLAPLSGIALECVDGGNIRNVNINNITMDDVRTPIFVRLGNRGGMYSDEKVPNPRPGTIRDIQISQIVATRANTASSITAVPGAYVQNIHLRDIIIRTQGGADKNMATKEIPEREKSYPEATMFGILPVSGLFVRHVSGLSLHNIDLYVSEPDARPLVLMDDVKELSMGKIDTDDNNIGSSIILLKHVDGSIYDMNGYKKKKIPWFLCVGDNDLNFGCYKKDKTIVKHVN